LKLNDKEVAMKDSIRERFEKAIKANKGSEQAARTEHQRIQDERRKFEAGWATGTISTVVPALEEIVSKILIPNGWEGGVRQEQSKVIFEAYKGDMHAINQGPDHPALVISPDPSENGVVVVMTTTLISAPVGTFNLEPLTADLIQDYAARFFEKLCAEREAILGRGA
jgi:hypothetical protein